MKNSCTSTGTGTLSTQSTPLLVQPWLKSLEPSWAMESCLYREGPHGCLGYFMECLWWI